MLKRYLVFSGPNYYPAGGWDDFDADFDTLEEAVKCANATDTLYNWAQVIDLETLEQVHSV